MKKNLEISSLIGQTVVPAFFPKKLVMTVSPVKFSFKSVLRREYASYLSAISAFLFIDIVRIIVFNNILYLEKNKLIFNFSINNNCFDFKNLKTLYIIIE